MFVEQATSVRVANRNCRSSLETLLRTEQVKPCVAAFINPETFHGHSLYLLLTCR